MSKRTAAVLVKQLANAYGQLATVPAHRLAEVSALVRKLDNTALAMIDALDVKHIAPIARDELAKRQRERDVAKRLLSLPAGFTHKDGAFVRPCGDDMHTKITRPTDGKGWVVARCYDASGLPQCGWFFPSWRGLLESFKPAE